MIGAGECSVAVLALERPGSGVLAQMSRQFVRASEAPLAADDRTTKRLLTCARQQNERALKTRQTAEHNS